jgi:hypothetical protein
VDDRADVVLGCGVEGVLSVGGRGLEAVDRLQRSSVVRSPGLGDKGWVEGQQLVEIGLDRRSVGEELACGGPNRPAGSERHEHEPEREGREARVPHPHRDGRYRAGHGSDITRYA